MKESSLLTMEFEDVVAHWAKFEITYALSQGFLSGVGKGCFKPDIPVTRGVYMTALRKLAGMEPTAFGKLVKKLSLLEEMEDGSQGENLPVTRDEAAVGMVRFATASKFVLPQIYVPRNFTDYKNISCEVIAEIKVAQTSGIVSSRGNYRLVPRSKITRGEFAAMLFRYTELVAGNGVGMGWQINDAGYWMYYKNGRPLIGQKTIDGVSYHFNRYGESKVKPQGCRYVFYQVKPEDTWRKIALNFSCDAFALARLNGKSVNSLIHPAELIKLPR